MPVWLPHMYQPGPVPQAPVPLTPPLDLSGAIESVFDRLDASKRRKMEEQRLELERQRQAAAAEHDRFQRGISQGYLDLGRQDRATAETTRQDKAKALRQKEVEDAWGAYMTAERSGNASLIAEAGARLSRLGLLDDRATGGGVSPEGEGIVDPWSEDMATPIEEGSSEAIVPPLGMVGPAQASDVEDIELEGENDPDAIRYPWGDQDASAALAEAEFFERYPGHGAPEDEEYTRELGERTRPLEGGPDVEIPRFVPDGEEETYLMLLAQGNSNDEIRAMKGWEDVGENVAPGGDRAAAETAGILEPGEEITLGQEVESDPNFQEEPEDPYGGLEPSALQRGSPGAPGNRFRDPVSGRSYEAPGLSTGANPLLVRESLQSLVDNAPSEDHKAAAEQAIAMAERIASGPDVTYEEAIEYGISLYEKRAAALEARGLQEMRTRNRGGGGSASGFSKADVSRLGGVSDDTREDIRLIATQEKFSALQQSQRDVNEVIARVSSRDALSQRGAIGSLLKSISGAAATDQERAFYLNSVGLPNTVLDKWANLFEGGELNEELLGQLRSLMQGANGRLAKERQRIGGQAYEFVRSRSGAMTPEEREAEAERARGFFTGYSPPSQKRASPNEEADNLINSGP